MASTGRRSRTLARSERRTIIGELRGWRLDLAQALARLSPEHREVVQLVLVHGFTYDEAAHIIGCPLGTIKSRLFHARRQLRGWLQACTEPPPEPCPE